MKYSKNKYPLPKESYQIIGMGMEVDRILGKGLLEIAYKDVIEYEFNTKEIPYECEKKYAVEDKGIILGHKLFRKILCSLGLYQLWRKLISNKKSLLIICESVPTKHQLRSYQLIY